MEFNFKNLTFEKAVLKLKELKSRRRDAVAFIDDLRYYDSNTIQVRNMYGADGSPLWVEPTAYAHGQIAEKFGIPKRYWDRMVTDLPSLAATSFNEWAHNESKEKQNRARKFLVRTYTNEPGGSDGILRALLSDSYFPIDNLSIIVKLIETIQYINDTRKTGVDLRVGECSLTDTNFYLKVTCPSIETQAPEIMSRYRDPHNGEFGGIGQDFGLNIGFVIRNSEVGAGQLTVAPLLKIRECSNNMIWHEKAFQRRHVGERLDLGDYAADTRKANFETIMLQVRDHLITYLSEDFLGKMVCEIEAMHAAKLRHPLKCCDNMCADLGLSNEDTDRILENFMKQGDVETVFSIAQAITSYAHTQDGDQQFILESAAMTLLPRWEKCDVDTSLRKVSVN